MICRSVDKTTWIAGDAPVGKGGSSPVELSQLTKGSSDCGHKRLPVDRESGDLAGLIATNPHSTGPTIPTKFISNSVVVEAFASM